jgi:hypothetical protein
MRTRNTNEVVRLIERLTPAELKQVVPALHLPLQRIGWLLMREDFHRQLMAKQVRTGQHKANFLRSRPSANISTYAAICTRRIENPKTWSYKKLRNHYLPGKGLSAVKEVLKHKEKWLMLDEWLRSLLGREELADLIGLIEREPWE